MKTVRHYLPHFVVFLSSMGVMIVELVASRIISKYYGNSLFTWTGVIGIVLGGISLGNWLGGRLADRYDPRRLLPTLLLSASALVFLVLVLDAVMGWIMRSAGFSSITVPVILGSVTVISVLFFLPAASLGTISPAAAKYALMESDRIGSTVGNIYAVSSIGSIFGTFLSGFLLIPLLGVRTIIFLVAVVLALLSLAVRGKVAPAAGWTAGILLIWLAVPQVQGDNVLYARHSMYSYISVQENGSERQLVMDGLIHNRYDPSAPDRLLYDYERIFKAVTDDMAEGAESGFDALTLGGGALTFPAYMERRYPVNVNRVVEIDPEVERVARRWFDISDDSEIDIVINDARAYVDARNGKERYGIVYLDAFSSFSVPYHLTTREFTRSLSGLLEKDGLLLVNLIDIFSLGRFLGAYVETLEEVFPYVEVYVDNAFSPGARSTFVAAAANRPIPAPELYDEDGRMIARIMTAEERAALSDRSRGIVLTDDYAPVENLIAPVFLRSIR